MESRGNLEIKGSVFEILGGMKKSTEYAGRNPAHVGNPTPGRGRGLLVNPAPSVAVLIASEHYGLLGFSVALWFLFGW